MKPSRSKACSVAAWPVDAWAMCARASRTERSGYGLVRRSTPDDRPLADGHIDDDDVNGRAAKFFRSRKKPAHIWGATSWLMPAGMCAARDEGIVRGSSVGDPSTAWRAVEQGNAAGPALGPRRIDAEYNCQIPYSRLDLHSSIARRLLTSSTRFSSASNLA